MEEQKLELSRKIDAWLASWKNNKDHKPALIKGVRQSGKTYSIKKFIDNKDNYEVAIYLNFWDNPELIDIFNADPDNVQKELMAKILG